VESGLFNGLRRIQIEKSSRLTLVADRLGRHPSRTLRWFRARRCVRSGRLNHVAQVLFFRKKMQRSCRAGYCSRITRNLGERGAQRADAACHREGDRRLSGDQGVPDGRSPTSSWRKHDHALHLKGPRSALRSAPRTEIEYQLVRFPEKEDTAGCRTVRPLISSAPQLESDDRH
jgi:hypothetical protein